MNEELKIKTIPFAPLKIIALNGMEELANRVNQNIVQIRHAQMKEHCHSLTSLGYESDHYLLQAECPRFGTGEGKAILYESVRGVDLYLLVDVVHSNITYQKFHQNVSMSPDDHFQDLKRVIDACHGKARRITVIMPYLYEGRQHKRSERESLDCAIALQELCNMGVENIITFDAHDPRVQNAIPLHGFDNFFTTLQFMRALFENAEDLRIDNEHLMIISPDEGGMSRAVYYANVLGVDMGMFYKRKNYSTLVNGKNPIVAHEFLGSSVSGKDVFLVDDMISSGEDILEVAEELKERNARKVYIAATYGLFHEGLSAFDSFYEKGKFERIFTTNLTYVPEELTNRSYYTNVDLSKYISLIINTLNHNTSVNTILNTTEKIQELLKEYQKKHNT